MMQKKVMKSKFIVVIILITNFVYGQTNEIKIKFIGNCGLHLTDGNTSIYIDFPYKSGAHNYMKYDNAQFDSIIDNSIFIFTHRHKDHYSKKLVKQMKRKFKGKIYGNWNVKQLNELNNTINEFTIKAIKTPHRFTFKHYSYLITWHGKKIYISGDTGSLDEISKIKNIDWCFINPWLFMNAQDEKITIDTKIFALYHLYPDQKINGKIPDYLKVLKTENEIFKMKYSKNQK